MQIFKTTTGLKSFLEDCRDNNKKISLVPTMGGLHDGHLKLVDRARAISDIVVVSIFGADVLVTGAIVTVGVVLFVGGWGGVVSL